MLFVDTNILIEVIRKNQLVLDWFATRMKEELIIHGLVLLELLVGVRDDQELKEIEQFARTFQVYWPTTADYDRAMDLAKRYYRYGLGAVDAVLAASTRNKRVSLCTLDRDFRPIPNLKIVEPYSK